MNSVTQYAQNEPVTLAGAITAAITATINLLALVFGWDGTIVAGLNLAIGAWVVVVSFIVREKVTPSRNVALTVADEAALNALSGAELAALRDDVP
jgi:fatty acid desaturase